MSKTKKSQYNIKLFGLVLKSISIKRKWLQVLSTGLKALIIL